MVTRQARYEINCPVVRLSAESQGSKLLFIIENNTYMVYYTTNKTKQRV